MLKKCGNDINLSEKFTSLIQPKPVLVESDNEDITTTDKIAPAETQSDFSADELDVPKFSKSGYELPSQRLQNRTLKHYSNDALENDKKYLGKKVVRKTLGDFSEDNDVDLEENKSENDEFVDEESEIESDIAGETEKLTEENARKVKLYRKRPICNDVNQKIFSKASEDIEKGKAIRNQLLIWDFLLDCRMKFQKCLLASNQFPNYKNFPAFQNHGGPEFQSLIVQSKKSLKHLLNSLFTLQNTLLNLNTDFLSCNTTQEKSEVDDEIPSGDSDINDSLKNYKSDKQLKRLAEFSKEICSRHENFKTYRNNTIQKWNDKTRIGNISSKNFSAFEQSTLKQIEHVLLDRQRLIKRTQTKRSNYQILGQEDEEPPIKKQAEESLLDNKKKGLEKEIFDDDDFYQQLLSELVKRKANDLMDPIQLGRQWMQLQKIRSKMKKTVDTKASKGRKVRFVVHPKLVNFMMPINNAGYNEESRTELLNSLFGKTKK